MLTAGCVVACVALLARPGPVRAARDVTVSAASVRSVYLRDCATCHGADARGTALGPNLSDAGPAMVDFQLATGRMPVPSGDASEYMRRPSAAAAQARRPAKYDAAVRRALVAYVTMLTGRRRPAIPKLDERAADLAGG